MEIIVCKKRNVVTLVDDVDYDAILEFFDSFSSLNYKRKKSHKLHPYAMGVVIGKKYKWVPIHRFVLSRKIGRELTNTELCDHINGDVLDNRRSNLRIANKNQNQFNKGVKFSSKSGHKGIYFESDRKKWRVQVTAFGKTHTKRFSTLEEAIRCSEILRKLLHKEFSSQ